ncbi:Gfo/Idh/MocA family protein [Ereboglobus luteus]|uniref:Oxidoreductase n=1 Tax=Ereboglobus luteus TaxID=1796921 RepID=A0A2U8E6Q5_9BACT|nr:Gfo/Idh/MocA family oxidoreductase [Ereboglobus luteus]AWI10496.1 oxidoreductase [Ereboglobus luteus]
MNQEINRRNFIGTMGIAAAGVACLTPRFAFAGEPASSRKLKIGVVGGGFGRTFHFHEHPNCTVEAVSDLIASRRQRLMKTYQCEKSYESLELLLRDPKIEAVAIFTPAPDHARHVIQTLNAGKHVLCAVPAVMNLDEAHQVLETVKRTGLTYMMAETSTYRHTVMSAKKFFKEGQFGNIFSSYAHYYHPGLEALYFTKDGKPTWRHGLPPMLYPTHATAMIVAVTGERLASVSCIGWGDGDPLLKGNAYGNPFWNETALFKTDKGHPFRAEIWWRGAVIETERGEWHGDKMSYYSGYKGQADHRVVATKNQGTEEGGFAVAKPKMERVPPEHWWNLLPEAMRHETGHGGSHVFITHEFVDSVINGREPEVNIREALAYTVPGIIAHESALKDGELLKIPVFG